MNALRRAGRPRQDSPPEPATGTDAAYAAFRRTLLSSAGYRRLITDMGVRPEAIESLDDVPFLDKQAVFSQDIDSWLSEGGLDDAAELLTSSGQSGNFSIGISSKAELAAQQEMTDAMLAAGGAGTRSTLLLNCLPMGINVPTTLATVATPSVHIEMALEIYRRLAPRFSQAVLLAEPVFMKEFAEEMFAGRAGVSLPPTSCYVGGEWVSESWRSHVGELFSMPRPEEESPAGILVSMGAAEVGLGLLGETPALRAARAALDDADLRRVVFGRDDYTPSLFTYDPRRFYIESREHDDGARTLAITTLGRRMLPLIRYDLDDLGEHVPAGVINRELERRGSSVRVPEPVVAVWGRRPDVARGPGWSLRPEAVKQRIFQHAAEATSLTGRFRIESGGDVPRLHLQLRAGREPTPRMAELLAADLGTPAGAPADITLHEAASYPFHEAGDYQHKPRYTARPAAE